MYHTTLLFPGKNLENYIWYIFDHFLLQNQSWHLRKRIKGPAYLNSLKFLECEVYLWATDDYVLISYFELQNTNVAETIHILVLWVFILTGWSHIDPAGMLVSPFISWKWSTCKISHIIWQTDHENIKKKVSRSCCLNLTPNSDGWFTRKCAAARGDSQQSNLGSEWVNLCLGHLLVLILLISFLESRRSLSAVHNYWSYFDFRMRKVDLILNFDQEEQVLKWNLR